MSLATALAQSKVANVSANLNVLTGELGLKDKLKLKYVGIFLHKFVKNKAMECAILLKVLKVKKISTTFS